jgi:hypothetical protein
LDGTEIAKDFFGTYVGSVSTVGLATLISRPHDIVYDPYMWLFVPIALGTLAVHVSKAIKSLFQAEPQTSLKFQRLFKIPFTNYSFGLQSS